MSHEAVIKLDQVVCNASYNTIHNNRGKSIMEVTGFNSVRLPIYQTFTHNGFYNNFAYGLHCEQTTYGTCRWGTRATVVAGSAGQEYVDNVFYNRENDYELATLNRSEWDVWKTPINAKYNYWAYNETAAVSGRISDLHDREGLLEVDFTPFHMNNRRREKKIHKCSAMQFVFKMLRESRAVDLLENIFVRTIFSIQQTSIDKFCFLIFSLLSGKCQPGWTLLDDTCWMYHGGPMTYKQGLAFCAKDNATLPTLRNYYQYHLLAAYLNREQVSIAYHTSTNFSPCISMINL